MARRTGAKQCDQEDNEKNQRRNRKCLESSRDLCQILSRNVSHADNGEYGCDQHQSYLRSHRRLPLLRLALYFLTDKTKGSIARIGRWRSRPLVYAPQRSPSFPGSLDWPDHVV